jgi:hypothetical protein
MNEEPCQPSRVATEPCVKGPSASISAAWKALSQRGRLNPGCPNCHRRRKSNVADPNGLTVYLCDSGLRVNLYPQYP